MGELKLRQRSFFEGEFNGRNYIFICDNDAPLGELHDVIMKIKGWSVDRMMAVHKQEEEASKELQKEISHEETEC